MASLDSLLDQIAKSDLDIAVLLRIRSAVEDRLASCRKELQKQLAAVEGAMAAGTGVMPRASTPAPRRGRPAGSVKRRAARSGTNAAGKHAGLSVAAAVTKALQSRGGKASASEIKKIFATAGDKRNLNFTLLTQAGTVKRVGFEQKKDGRKGRAGGIYAIG